VNPVKGNFIGGEWTGSASGRTRDRRNPADERELVATAPDSTADDARAAVAAVAAGYREWAERGPEVRARTLERAADIMERAPGQLAAELVREEGKTLAEARAEVTRTPANLRFYAGEALRLSGQTYQAADRSLIFSSREPVGVVVAITPWNFPLNIPARKLGPALAAGNGVVFKPSEVTPLMGQRLVEALLEAGVPAGALALVHGGAAAGAALVADERVGAVTFTGSCAVGAAIHHAAGPARRCQLEMGGKNPVVVLPDADLDRAAQIVDRGAFGLSGQACTGTSRVIVHEKVHDALLARLVDGARRRRLGNGLADGVDSGPLATRGQLERVRGYLDSGTADGGRLMTGDEPLGAELAGGYFARPAVFTDVEPGSRLAQEEVFGPVLSFHRVGSFEEAVTVANQSEYGLAAGIVTGDLGQALRFAREADAGVVKVNQPTTGVAINAPFGGVKQSSSQTFKEQAGDTMMKFYTVDKTIYISS
jgi:alpha-ketoglutaric semialdehyde dehydrogenase